MLKKIAYGLLTVLLVVLLVEHLFLSSVLHMAYHNFSSYLGESKQISTGANANEDTDPRLEKLAQSPVAYAKALKELRELESMPSLSPQAAEIRNYLEWLLSIPWSEKDESIIDLKKAREVLDKDHYGLDKVKELIIEYLAVQKRVANGKAPIICFIGPPGVGKTTLAKSIAKATGRKFVRVPLGGVRDEATIRGFLRTYTSSKPGKIVQAMKEAGTKNPVMLLDEIDKISQSNYAGDPSAALLEVLDPSQNDQFKDHFLETPYDLSNVMFIATANSYEIPGPLRDRMEIIDLSSYTLDEKKVIARKHLIKNQMKENGLKPAELSLPDQTVEKIINEYTAEAGVRQLDRSIGSICRKAVRQMMDGNTKNMVITPALLHDYLGPAKITETKPLSVDTVGVTQGLAWTAVGGKLLPIEAMIVPGTGKVIQTGNLGKVQQESITAAVTVVKSMLPKYGLKADVLKNKDIHIHAPEAAIKKDGPSAGVTITTSMISVLTNIPVRKDVCMTGEITLHGKVLPIGGLKEKLIAAHRAGLKIALIPKENVIHLEELPKIVKKEMKIIPVDHISEALKVALRRKEA